jgi:toxin ParE1/3/4
MHVKFKVEITPAAERDVEEIWIEEQIDTLEQLPERCPLIPENEQLGTSYRHLLHGAYRTIFRINGKTVYILRIIHGTRLLDSSCFES